MEERSYIMLLFIAGLIKASHGIPFIIGVGGNIETYGSLLHIPNQTINLVGFNYDVFIDFPSTITCNIMHHGYIQTLFCPDPFLYYRWETLFRKLIKRHSHLVFTNVNNKDNFTYYDCPEGGTILTYGDNRCEVHLPNGMVKQELHTNTCKRLVPFVIPSLSKVVYRKVNIWLPRREWEEVYLPCVSSLYVCAYGPPPSITSIENKDVTTINSEILPGFPIDAFVVRDTKHDCVMERQFQDTFAGMKACIFHLPSYNTSNFVEEVKRYFQVNESDDISCTGKTVCGPEQDFCINGTYEEVISDNLRTYFNNDAQRNIFTCLKPSLSPTPKQTSNDWHGVMDRRISKLEQEHYYLIVVIGIILTLLVVFICFFSMFIFYNRNILFKDTPHLRSVYQTIPLAERNQVNINIQDENVQVLDQNEEALYEEPIN